jgi:alpha-glucoside transport system substrate-binding protein
VWEIAAGGIDRHRDLWLGESACTANGTHRGPASGTSKGMSMTTTKNRRWVRSRSVVALLALSLVATACLDEGGGGSADGEGQTVNVLTAFTEPDDVRGFEAMLAAFNEASGHNAVHEGSPDFETQSVTLVEGGNPPDVMMHPQPGLLESFAEQGAAQPLDFLTDDQLGGLVPGLVDVGTFDDQLYGLQVRLSLKSMVWYAKQPFDEAGYTEPETWDELLELGDAIVAEGTADTAWCIGIESSGATGWVATDWMEDIMLRLHGPDVYDDWVANELAFDSDEVREAGEMMADIWFDDDLVLGGRSNILQTNFGSSPLPMFEEPPGCLLHRQASFIQGSFPEDAVFGEDYDFFYLPAIDEEVGAPVLIAGDLAGLYSDNEAARELIEFMTTAEAQEAWAAEGGFLCSITTCDQSVYPNESFVQQDGIIAEADFARFDGSDLMPGAVGAGAFWTEMVRWINGEVELEEALTNIDDAWPSS